ncbi:hypothetical protein SKAU_G00185240 [Synaphobranchus kaupii]|uniref:Uncharacterized protein n=1 Tax=Synaphobranchus kaupii TaxID=118154 RepID=A0A9Q1FCV1_SYNKA|nr:hypothetical protein SKAU_G00185240 [Synaphobranchus kaupii]
MGASISARQDGKTEEDATTEEQNAEVNEIQEGEEVDAKHLLRSDVQRPDCCSGPPNKRPFFSGGPATACVFLREAAVYLKFWKQDSAADFRMSQNLCPCVWEGGGSIRALRLIYLGREDRGTEQRTLLRVLASL